MMSKEQMMQEFVSSAITPLLERVVTKKLVQSFDVIAEQQKASNRSMVRRINDLEAALRKAACRLERYAVQVDGEWGESRDASELYADGDMPEELLAIRSLLNKEPPCNE